MWDRLELQDARLSPAGSGRSQEALHHRPWPGLMTVTVTRLWGSCWAPTWPCAGDLQPCSLTWGHGCLFSLGREALSGPGYAVSRGGGPARGLDTDWAQAWCRAARGASYMSAVQPGRYPEMGLCSCLCSCLVSSGQAGEGRATRRAHLSAPRTGLPTCPHGTWASVASGDCLSFQWFLGMSGFGEQSLDFFPIFLQLRAG